VAISVDVSPGLGFETKQSESFFDISIFSLVREQKIKRAFVNFDLVGRYPSTFFIE